MTDNARDSRIHAAKETVEWIGRMGAVSAAVNTRPAYGDFVNATIEVEVPADAAGALVEQAANMGK